MSNINVGYIGGQVVWLGCSDSIMHVVLPACFESRNRQTGTGSPADYCVKCVRTVPIRAMSQVAASIEA